MSPAETCRERGWKVGAVVEGPDAFGGVSRVRITAIGERCVLGIEIDARARPAAGEEAWSVSWRDWKPAPWSAP